MAPAKAACARWRARLQSIRSFDRIRVCAPNTVMLPLLEYSYANARICVGGRAQSSPVKSVAIAGAFQQRRRARLIRSRLWSKFSFCAEHYAVCAKGVNVGAHSR
jgi:hypothetical protein